MNVQLGNEIQQLLQPINNGMLQMQIAVNTLNGIDTLTLANVNTLNGILKTLSCNVIQIISLMKDNNNPSGIATLLLQIIVLINSLSSQITTLETTLKNDIANAVTTLSGAIAQLETNQTASFQSLTNVVTQINQTIIGTGGINAQLNLISISLTALITQLSTG